MQNIEFAGGDAYLVRESVDKIDRLIENTNMFHVKMN